MPITAQDALENLFGNIKRKVAVGNGVNNKGEPVGIEDITGNYYKISSDYNNNRKRTDEIVFHSEALDSLSSSPLGDSYFVVSYRGNLNHGTSMVGLFTGDSIEWKTPEIKFNSATTSIILSSQLGDSHFVVSYQDGGNSNYGTSRIGYFTGDSIEWLSEEVVFYSASVGDIASSPLGDSYFVVSYKDSSSYGTSIVGYFTGDSIEWLSGEIVFHSTSMNYPSSSPLGDSYFVVNYKDNSSYGTSIVGYFTGDSIEWLSGEIAFNSATTFTISSSPLGDSYFVVSYRDDGNSSYGTSRIGYFTGDSIEWKTGGTVFNTAVISDLSSCPLGNNYFVVNYRDPSSGTSRIGYFTGDSIEWKTEKEIFHTDATFQSSSSQLGDSHFVVSYQDGGNSNYGTSIILKKYRTFFIGIAGDSVSTGDSVFVQYNGVMNDFPNLNAGVTYYLDYTDGSLTTTITEQKVGIAVGDTELLITRD